MFTSVHAKVLSTSVDGFSSQPSLMPPLARTYSDPSLVDTVKFAISIKKECKIRLEFFNRNVVRISVKEFRVCESTEVIAQIPSGTSKIRVNLNTDFVDDWPYPLDTSKHIDTTKGAIMVHHYGSKHLPVKRV